MRTGGISGETYRVDFKNCLNAAEVWSKSKGVMYTGSLGGIAGTYLAVDHCFWTEEAGYSTAYDRTYTFNDGSGRTLENTKKLR